MGKIVHRSMPEGTGEEAGRGEGRGKNIRSVFFSFDQGKFYNLTRCSTNNILDHVKNFGDSKLYVSNGLTVRNVVFIIHHSFKIIMFWLLVGTKEVWRCKPGTNRSRLLT